MTPQPFRLVLCCMAAACVLACGTGCASLPKKSLPEDLPHFSSVDGKLLRGGQPTSAGFRRLSELGVKTVINLRGEDELLWREERRFVESLGMRWVHLPMWAYTRPRDEQVMAFLRIALDPTQQPVFLHCRQGQDRTGGLVAVYRIIQEGWPPERAYAEALDLGLASWNPFMRKVILTETLEEYHPSLPPASADATPPVPPGAGLVGMASTFFLLGVRAAAAGLRLP